MRYLFLILLSTVCLAQRNEVAVSAVGNFNPTSTIWIQNTPHDVLSTNRSAMGGEVGYQRWVRDHIGVGFQYEQNPSSGKLLWAGNTYEWPQMRYEFMAVSSQRVAGPKTAVSLKEGIGAIVTQGLCHCAGVLDSGWSHDFAFLYGFNVDQFANHRVMWRFGLDIIEAKTGCYGDHTCRATWAAVEDVNTGIVVRF